MKPTSWSSQAGVGRLRKAIAEGAGSATGWLKACIAAIVLVAGLSPLPASAGGSSQASCVTELRLTLSPGLSMSPSTVSYGTSGASATITCLGSVNGHAVTGPGTIEDRGIARAATCASGAGTSVLSMKIPTAGGLVAMAIPVDYTFVGGVGQRPAGMFPGGFVFIPTRGDCILTPVTEVAVVVYGTLST